jgi:secreted pullulanase
MSSQRPCQFRFNPSILLLLLLLTISPFAKASFNENLAENQLRIHYHNSHDNLDDLGIWFWGDVKIPSTNWPSGAMDFPNKDQFGLYIDIDLNDNPRQISFLIVDKKTGEKESGNKVFEMNKLHNELWVKYGDDRVYVTSEFKQKCELVSASIIEADKIELRFSTRVEMNSEIFRKNLQATDFSGTKLSIENLKIDSDKAFFNSNFSPDLVPLSITFAEKSVECQPRWQLIDEWYACPEEELGCKMLSSQHARLKLWAPKAEKVEVLVYDRNDQTKVLGKKPMSKGEKAVWTCDVTAADFSEMTELIGNYYQYEVTNKGREPKLILDPYAASMAPVTISPDGISSGSSNDMIGKAAFVNPEIIGKEPTGVKIKGYQKREDAIIYEIHVRDFTSDPSIKDELSARWGTFAAFKSRLSYIRSLGVTHIQLLPVMAWYFGDETKMNERELSYSARNNQYNWGYDPHNYFSLDGAYSENPEDAKARIAEFKELVDAIHKEGMGVILDVVYTHMARADFLEDIVPDYYFFRDNKGSLLGDFGNNLGTNRIMAEKLIIDSVKHWFKTYKIDGMRWDMMGDATQASVQKAFNAAKEINPDAIFIGEGWRTFKGHLEDKTLVGLGADQDWMSTTDDVGVFSDEFRNELKSGFGCEGEPRFLTGGPRSIQQIFKNIKALPDNTPNDSPGDMVHYIAAHDNLPLYDVIAQSIKKDPAVAENDLEIHRRIRLGNAILLTSQGTAFIHAGQEFGRTKQWKAPEKPEHKFHEMVDSAGKPFKHPYFIHDSYDSSDAINMFEWKKATDVSAYPTNVTTREFTAGLIRLRRSTDAFSLGSQELIESNVTLIECPEISAEDLVIAYRCQAGDGTVFYVFINADDKKRKLTLQQNLCQAEVIVAGETAGTDALVKPEGLSLAPDSIDLEPLTCVILRSKR